MVNNIEEITICTVLFEDDILLQKNIKKISDLNEKIKINWIIAINKNINKKTKFENYGSNILLIDGINENLIGSAALHHTIALNLTKKEVKTRFVLFIDPDFFLIKNNFLNEMIDYMQKNDVTLIGAPWYPKWHSKFRYFPCHHCMFVNTKKIDLDLLDFRPIKVTWNKEFKESTQNKKCIPFYKFILKKIFGKFLYFILFMFFYRKENGFDGDTSSRIYLKLLNANIKYKIFNPYFNVPKDWLVPIPWSINRIIEFFLPEKFCYFPKKKSFIKYNEKFGDFLSEKAYEGFYWKDYPIGFHIRGHPKRMIAERDKRKEANDVEYVFNHFFKN